jgi:hypothetical protein
LNVWNGDVGACFRTGSRCSRLESRISRGLDRSPSTRIAPSPSTPLPRRERPVPAADFGDSRSVIAGEIVDDLKAHLRDLYQDITGGHIPGIRKVEELVVS